MKNKLFFVFACCCSFYSYGQFQKLNGKVADETGKGLPYAMVTLSYPKDSTVAYYVSSDSLGVFEFRSLLKEKYLMTIHAEGYIPFQRSLTIQGSMQLPTITLQPIIELDSISVTAERLPIVIKKDTLEYNAGAFPVKQDAVVEDLLKKMPGIDIDANGNIKAQGSPVNKIMLDGKEFFSSDPKIVTKNFPADAVKKVQVFNEKTDDEAYSGIANGNTSTTMNIVLKEDRKNNWFGSAMGGIGSNARYQSSLKAFQFKPEHQFAFLGMSNNVNQFGFSFQEYIDFNGGIQQFMNGSGTVKLDEDTPLSTGLPIYGRLLSGLEAFNYTHSKTKGRNFTITSIGSLQNKKLDQFEYTKNFLPDITIHNHQTSFSNTTNRSMGLNLNYSDKSDSLRFFETHLNLSSKLNNGVSVTSASDSLGETALNTLNNHVNNSYSELCATAGGSYSKRLKKTGLINFYKVGVDGDYHWLNNDSNWENRSESFLSQQEYTDVQQLRSFQKGSACNLSLLASKKLSKKWFLEPVADATYNIESLDMHQGNTLPSFQLIDSLSGALRLTKTAVTPGIQLKTSYKKWSASLKPAIETGYFSTLHQKVAVTQQYAYFTPSLSLNYDFKLGNSIGVTYQNTVNTPSVQQLNPIPSTVNRLQVMQGNNRLTPEYVRSVNINWQFYDNFSFMSCFMNLHFAHTKDKIALSRTMLPDFSQSLTYTNVDQDLMGYGNFDFSTPIRKLHMIASLKVQEQWNKGQSLLNGALISTHTFVQTYELKIENRKKKNWDISGSYKLQLNSTGYTVQSQKNTRYKMVDYRSKVEFRGFKRWNFELSSDIHTFYTGAERSQPIVVPIISSSVTFYALKSNRLSLTVHVYDLLNKNQGIQQQNFLNFSSQSQSSVLKRYIMGSLNYKLKSKKTKPAN